jgi:hypothetical protein
MRSTTCVASFRAALEPASPLNSMSKHQDGRLLEARPHDNNKKGGVARRREGRCTTKRTGAARVRAPPSSESGAVR